VSVSLRYLFFFICLLNIYGFCVSFNSCMWVCRGAELRLVLWGDRAVEFDADLVRAMGDKEPVIGIFVGTLTKTHRGNCKVARVFTLLVFLVPCNSAFVYTINLLASFVALTYLFGSGFVLASFLFIIVCFGCRCHGIKW
jgi:hypothetical protein